MHRARLSSCSDGAIHRSSPAVRRNALLFPMNIPEITPAEFVARRDRGEALTLLDVREGWEIGVANVPGTVHIPMGEVAARIGELNPTVEVVVLCRSGRRSLEVARYLQQNGFRTVNLAGGILAWSRDLDATIPTY
jgi:rhodanese-related sulfurtransferase